MFNFRKSIFFILVLCSVTGLFAKGKVFNKDYSNIEGMYATMKTHEGVMRFELLFREAPNTVANFADLSNKGFYDGLTFHRVIQGFMTQGGDPKGDGTGGPGYTIDEEPNNLSHTEGVLAMANSGPNTGGSQFYITHMPQKYLDGRHTVFGTIIEGFDVLTRIEKGDIIQSIQIEEIQK
jgi:peptidyl-prolyl cis-trans isomerase B (cyclophilin B)